MSTTTKSSIPSTDFIKSALTTAHHFGFRALDELKEDSRCKNCVEQDAPKILAQNRRLDALNGILTSGAAAYFEHNLYGLNEPALFYTLEETPRTNDIALSLQILGIEKSIAESLLMHTIRSLLRDLTIEEHVLTINSLGDRESLGRYTRELGNYLRKRIEIMPGHARELMKEHVLYALGDLLEREHEIGLKSPSPLEYLNEVSRKHFREIVEYLDHTETPYEIDGRLLGHHQCYSHTIFTIKTYSDSARTEPTALSIRGGRYDEFMYHITKKALPAVGAVLTLKGTPLPSRIPKHKGEEPQVFVVQLGFGPKMRTLAIMETLKAAGIPVFQALSSDSLGAQLERARARNVPYTIILGQKEYVENTVIVRDMRSSSQESVTMHALPAYLRRAIRV